MVDRLRGRAGVKQRKRRLRAEPLCRICKANGCITAATVPDHIKPLARGGTDEDSNIRCLCADCHALVTAEQFGRAASKALGGCDERGMPTNPDHPWFAHSSNNITSRGNE